MLKQSQKMKIFAASQIDKIMSLTESEIKKGQSIIPLNMGIPYYGMLPEIKAQLPRLLEKTSHDFYTSFSGSQELKNKLAEISSKKIGRPVSDREIVLTVGAMAGLYNIFLTLLNRGDEVIIPAPYFYSYRQQVELVGGKAVEINLELNSQQQFELPVEKIKAALTPKTKAILINSPHNPTGAVFSEKNLRDLAAILIDRKIYIITDEVYDYLTFDDQPCFNIASLQELEPYLIRCYSYSKIFGMTGWRIGYLQAHPEITANLYGVNMDTVICAPTISQAVILSALNQPQLPTLKKNFRQLEKNRQIILSELDQCRDFLTYVKPQGTYYVWAKHHLKMTSYELTSRLIKEAQVAIFPGTGFGEVGEGWIRFSFGGPLEKIKPAFQKIRDWYSQQI